MGIANKLNEIKREQYYKEFGKDFDLLKHYKSPKDIPIFNNNFQVWFIIFIVVCGSLLYSVGNEILGVMLILITFSLLEGLFDNNSHNILRWHQEYIKKQLEDIKNKGGI